jgi:hypothetical protein
VVAIPKLLPFAEPNLKSGYESLIPIVIFAVVNKEPVTATLLDRGVIPGLCNVVFFLLNFDSYHQ